MLYIIVTGCHGDILYTTLKLQIRNMTNKEKKNLLELGIAAAIVLGVSAWYKWMSRKSETTVVVVEENDNRRRMKLSACKKARMEKLLQMHRDLTWAIKHCDANYSYVSDPYKYCADDDDVDAVELRLHNELLELEGLETDLYRVERLLEKLGVKPS